jgi:tetratricopeptide (TPR) repeat protein
MGNLTNSQFNQKVWQLIGQIGTARNDDQAGRFLHDQLDLLLDRRFVPTLFEILDVASVRTGETNHARAMAYHLSSLAREVLIELPPTRINRGGVVTLLMGSGNRETFGNDCDHLRLILDDAFFDEFRALCDDVRQRGLNDLAENAEMRQDNAMLFLTLARLDEMRNAFLQARSPHAAIESLVQAALTMPRWFGRGLAMTLSEAGAQTVPEFELILMRTMQRTLDMLTAGSKPEAVVRELENDSLLRRYIEHYQAPPAERVPDMLAMYGDEEKQRLIDTAGELSAQMQGLFKLALASNEIEEWEAISAEPTVLSQQAEQDARRMSHDAAQQKQFTLSDKMLCASERIKCLLSELAEPDRNIIARLAHQVCANELSLDQALTQMNQSRALQGLGVPHLAAMDEQVTGMYHGGNLRDAEIVATLNHVATQRMDNLKIRADVSISLAEIKSELGNNREAVPLLQEAENLAHQIGDPQRLIRAVGPLGTAYQHLDDYPNAIKCYERALQIARETNLDHLIAPAFGNLASVYLLMGNLNAALDYSDQSLRCAQDAQDPFQVSQALGNRALILHQLSRYDEALALYQDALRVIIELGDLTSEIRVRSHLAQAYLEIGKYDQAIDELERARTLAQRTANLPLQATILASFGALYYQRGDFNHALQYLQQSLEIEERLGLREKAATSLVNLAPLYLRLQQLDRAKDALDRALILARQIRSPRIEAHAQLGLGRYFTERGEWQDSTTAYRETEQLAQKMNDPQLELMALGNLGRVEEMQNHLIQAAQAQSDALERARHLGSRVQEAQALISLGAVQAKLQDHTRAHETLTEAVRLTQELGLPHAEFYAHDNLGLLYESALGDLNLALEHYHAAIKVLEQERQLLGDIEEFEQKYLEDKQYVYRRAAQVLLKLNQPLEAIQALEQGRARLLARRLLQRDALPPNVPEELRTRYTRTVQAVQFFHKIVDGEPSWGMKMMDELRRGIAELKDKPIDEQQELQGYKKGLAEAEAELAHIIESIRGYAPNFGGVNVNLPQLDFAEITRDALTAIVALFIGDSISHAIVLHASGTRVIDLPNFTQAQVQHLLHGVPEQLADVYMQLKTQMPKASTLDEVGDAPLYMHYMTLRFMIEETESFELGWQAAVRTLISEKTQADQLARLPKLPEEFQEKTLFDIDDAKRLSMWQHVFNVTAHELKTRLWQPLLPVLRECGASRIVVIPDQDLHSLPFAIGLVDETNVPSITIVPSLSLYAQCIKWLREREPRENSLMLVANPTQDLDAAELEARLLRDLFAVHNELTFALTGAQATQQHVLRTSRVGNYWHFAGHARYVWWNPNLSALSLAKDEQLPIYWVPMWMDLRATRLATLSACETAMTPVRDPAQEFAGLFTAFLTAGVPTVLASLWPVENISTALLMYRFYQYHLGDPRESIPPHPPADALRDAQTWLRELTYSEMKIFLIATLDPTMSFVWSEILGLEKRVKDEEHPYNNPYFWAGFMVVGA